MSTLPNPCWITRSGLFTGHHATEQAARDYARDRACEVYQRETPCALSAECAQCGMSHGDGPVVHYPSEQRALEDAVNDGWQTLGGRAWCYDCAQDAPELIADRARRDAEAMTAPLPGLIGE